MKNTVNTTNERLNEKELRFMPIGTQENMFAYLQQLSGNQMKLLMGLQEMSMQDPLQRKYSTADLQTRYVDITDISMKSIYKKLGMTEPTGISCMKKLKEYGWIKEFTSEQERKYIIIKNSVGSNDFWTKCSLNADLYKIIKGACTRDTVKVYLYHCFQGGMNKKNGYTYKVSREEIAKAIGASQKHLERITDANNLLIELGVIAVDKKWKKDSEGFKIQNVYHYNHLYRTRRQIEALEKQLAKEEDLTNWCPW
nr:hypothetical protein [uncultured Cellulosilyticum sp.]